MTDVNDLGSLPVDLTPNNVPAHLQDLKNRINAGSLARRLTQAQIDALPAGQKVIGVMVYNLTAQRYQSWDGAQFKNVSGITINDDGSISVPKVTVGGMVVDDSGGGFSRLVAAGNSVRLQAGSTRLTVEYNNPTTTNRPTAASDPALSLVTKGYVDALGAWQDWSPVLTLSAGTPVNWTSTGRFSRIGKTVVARFQVSFDSGIGTSTGAALRVSLPVASAAALTGTPVGSARMNRMAAGGFPRADVLLASTSHVEFDSGILRWADNVPHSLAAGDVIAGQLTYETA